MQSQHGRNMVATSSALRVQHTDHVIIALPIKWRNGEEAGWLFSESKFLKPESLVELVKVSVCGCIGQVCPARVERQSVCP